MTNEDLICVMQNNVLLAHSFSMRRGEGYTGDMFWFNANDAEAELEQRGCTVLRQWTVLVPDDDNCPLTHMWYDLPED